MSHVRRTDSDELEQQLEDSLARVADRSTVNEWSYPEWTRHVKNEIGHLLESHGCNVFANKCDFESNSEWLFDMVGARLDEGSLVDLDLVVESEWGDYEEISNDFQKLLVARAKHRLMILSAHNTEQADHFQKELLEEIEICELTQGGDRFLFAIHKEDTNRFQVASYVVQQERRGGSGAH